MRFGWIVVALAAVFAGLSPVSAQAHGHGGGHVTYIPVYIPGQRSVFFPPANSVGVKFELLPGPATSTEGVLAPDVVIARRTLRSSEAIVLTQPVKTEKVEIAAGTVMVRVVQSKPQAQQVEKNVWCAVRTYPALHPATTDCLEDVNGKGELVVALSGFLAEKGAPMSVIGLSLPLPGLVEPAAAYRAARPEELPTVEIGYRFCSEGDGVKIPWRFTTSMLKPDGTWTKPPNACPFGEWPDAADNSLEQVDAVKVKFKSAPDATHFQVMSEIAAGPMGPVWLGEPIQPPGALSREAKQEIESHSGPGLVPVGASKVLAGLVKHTGVIAQIGVVHGITGVLKTDVRQKAWLAPRSVPAGTYAFGVPTNLMFSGGRALVWCAVEMKDNDPAKPVTTCFPPVGQKIAYEPSGNILWYTHTYTVLPVIEAIGLDVERKPMTYPAPMMLTYVFDRWTVAELGGGNREIQALLGLEIQVNGVTTPIQKVTIRPNGGAYRFNFDGLSVSLVPVDAKGQPVTLAATSGPNEVVASAFQPLDDGAVQILSSAPPLQVAPGAHAPGGKPPAPPSLIKPWDGQSLPGPPPPLRISPPSPPVAQPTAPGAP